MTLKVNILQTACTDNKPINDYWQWRNEKQNVIKRSLNNYNKKATSISIYQHSFSKHIVLDPQGACGEEADSPVFCLSVAFIKLFVMIC